MKKAGEQWEGGCHQLIPSTRTSFVFVCYIKPYRLQRFILANVASLSTKIGGSNHFSGV